MGTSDGTAYHVWLMLADEMHRMVAGVIADLARRLEAPLFEPHITLVGNVTGTEAALDRCSRTFAATVAPFAVKVGPPAYSEAYFQCLFLPLRSRVLHQAHARACRVFQTDSPAPYRPHLSLAYGTYPEDRKRTVLAQMAGRLPGACDVTTVSLIRADSRHPMGWQEILRVPLGGERISC